jgi:DNA-3-methyladenine glycosylase
VTIFETLQNVTATEAAKRLLGCELIREINGQTIRVRIVETEAYDQTDAASHSFNGQTPRSDVMFGASGHLYVYFTYGMHYCCNIVVGEPGYGAAALIRAVEPIVGEEIMRTLRDKDGIELSNGPAKLCQALMIDKAMNGHDLHESPLQLIDRPILPSRNIVTTTRIGISRAKDEPWRFYIRENPYVSKQ